MTRIEFTVGLKVKDDNVKQEVITMARALFHQAMKDSDLTVTKVDVVVKEAT